MNSKYFEYIVVYSAVIVGCLLLGILARMFVINMGADDFTAGIVFWIVVLLGILAYAILTLLIDGLYSATVRWFFPRKKSKLLDEKSDISDKLEKIRAEQQQFNDKAEQDKKDVALRYTQKEFAAYCSDKDLDIKALKKLLGEEIDFETSTVSKVSIKQDLLVFVQEIIDAEKKINELIDMGLSNKDIAKKIKFNRLFEGFSGVGMVYYRGVKKIS